ncbi:hypothetical protein NSK_005355 [Nannochloropsis salina CCMP1776]|uniref:Uncharacterized protein n=1 Tax=Nannochloropsis salina CCMP1776 TaxID=1027361 RepID=A0A4D9CVG7_9STRA|nr:hypothetical protein NSK_005355 [Nannochloropsis salina CCMP1776]|eukprot:TFJ83291.1 hypothetical protein NSK_005355 [Nannochloropsis salina CCMP1776]
MGNSLNPLKTPEPVHTVLGTRPVGYEIRAYKPFLVAEVDNSAGDNSQAFRTLARYIGVEREGGREGGRVGRMFQAIALTRGALRE